MLAGVIIIQTLLGPVKAIFDQVPDPAASPTLLLAAVINTESSFFN